MSTSYSDWFGTSNKYIKYRIEFYTNWVDVANNCTNINVKVFIHRTNTGYTTSGSGTCYCRINGTTYTQSITSSDKITNNGIYLFNRDVTIYHNADGNVSFDIIAQFDHSQFTSNGQGINVSLATIPRRSTITNITGGTMGDSMTVTIDQKSSSFTTSVYVRAGGCDWQCVVSKQSGTSFTFTLPIDLANHVTQAAECTGQVLVHTYNGDTLIGEDSWDKWMGIPDWVKPSISQVLLDTDTCVGKDGWLFVQWKSKMRVRTTASGSYGSSITNIRVDYDGTQYWGSDIWTNIQTINGNRPVNVTVWDSRGRTATWSGNATVQWYQNPWGSLSAYRCDANGNRNDTGGKYVKVIYSGYKASLNGHNGFGLAIVHRESGKEWSPNDVNSSNEANGATAILGTETSSYDLDKTYEIKLAIWDNYTTTNYIVPISTAEVLLDFKPGGKGLGVGRIATKEYAAQFATAIEIYSGRDNNPAIGSDLRFCNVSNEAQDIIICGGAPAEDYLLSILRATTSASGGTQRLMHIDKWNNCYNTYPINYYSGNTVYYGNNAESQVKFDGSNNYLFFHNPNGTYNNHNMGAYSSSGGSAIWEYVDGASQLLLKSGYGTVSDERLKYDIDEFSNWDNYYNFYMDLKPLTFKYNEDMRNETHIGMKAQEVAESIVENNLNNDKLCIVKCIENKDMEDGREYNLAYQEFIPLNIKMIQKHEKEIQQLNNIIAQQHEQINQLTNLVNELINKGAE